MTTAKRISANHRDGETRRASLRDVAELANVAVSTASRALSGANNVRPGLRDRVLAAAHELGYERNLLAQSLRIGSSMSIGFVVRDISNPMMAEVVLGAERTLRNAGYALSLTNSEGERDQDAQYIRFFRQRAVDGLLLSLSDETWEPTLAELTGLKQPFVAVDRELPEELGNSVVFSDHAAGVQSALRHLTLLGHTKIGLLAGPKSLRPAREAARGLEEFCALHPDLDAVVEYGPFTAEFGSVACSRLMTSADRPTALILGGYQILLGVVTSLKAFGLRMPDDVSVVTFDDLESLPFFDPPIAALSREPLELGRRAAELLLARLAGDDVPARITAPVVYRPRASCGPVPKR